MCYTYFLRFFDFVNIIFLNSNLSEIEESVSGLNGNMITSRLGTIAGNQSITSAIPQGSIIFIGRKDADAYGLYMIDNWNKICTFAENSQFATLTYASASITIKNNISVAISYVIIMPK